MDFKKTFRKTLASSVFIEGRGVHKNEQVRLVFHPAKPGTSILFRQKKNDKFYEISNCFHSLTSFVSNTSFSVEITQDEASVQTIEHLMFAIYASEITDLIVDVIGCPELPILDGSAINYLETFEQCGFLVYEGEEIKPIIISKEIFVGDNNRYLKISPYPSLSIDCTIDYPHPMLTKSQICAECTPRFMKEKVAPARTFGFLEQAKELREKGYAQGASDKNTIIFTETSTLNALRFPQEAVFHKILDIIGDLALLGRPIQGHIEANCSGHSLDLELVKKIEDQIKGEA